MSGLRVVDKLSPSQPWRLSSQIQRGFATDGMQFATFRGQLYGVMVDTTGSAYWNNFHRDGFQSWDDQKVPLLEYAKGNPAVAVLDDRFYVAVKGSEDKIFVVWTEDFVDWKYLLGSWSVGDFKAATGPSMVTQSGRLTIAAAGKDNRAYVATVDKTGTVLYDWKQVAGTGTTKLTPLLKFYRSTLYCFVAGPYNKDIWSTTCDQSNPTSYKWSGRWRQIEGPIFAGTNFSAMPYSDNKLWFAWVGEDNNITFATFDGEKLSDPEILEYDFGQGSVGTATFRGRLYISYSGTEAMNGPTDDVLKAKL